MSDVRSFRLEPSEIQSAMPSAFDSGYDARKPGCHRVLASPESDEQLEDWRRAWDAGDREVRSARE